MTARLEDCDKEMQAMVRDSWIQHEFEQRSWIDVSVDQLQSQQPVHPERQRAEAAKSKGHHVLQAAIFTLSAAAIMLINLGGTPETHLTGNIIGIAAQPLWLYSTWRSREWGIFLLALVYLGNFALGIASHF